MYVREFSIQTPTTIIANSESTVENPTITEDRQITTQSAFSTRNNFYNPVRTTVAIKT